MDKRYYSDGITEVTAPLILSRCTCGHEFWRLMKRMECTCARCGKILRYPEEERGENPLLNLD